MRLLTLSTAIILAACGSAFAQAGNNTGNNEETINQGNQGSSAQNTNNASQLPDQVKDDLEQAGFSDVQVVPQSFLVQAKDKNGRPVMMLIHENSIMAISGYPEDGSGTTGSGADSDQDSNSMPGETGGHGAGSGNNSGSGK